jgi:hypothetical protein
MEFGPRCSRVNQRVQSHSRRFIRSPNQRFLPIGRIAHVVRSRHGTAGHQSRLCLLRVKTGRSRSEQMFSGLLQSGPPICASMSTGNASREVISLTDQPRRALSRSRRLCAIGFSPASGGRRNALGRASRKPGQDTLDFRRGARTRIIGLALTSARGWLAAHRSNSMSARRRRADNTSQ